MPLAQKLRTVAAAAALMAIAQTAALPDSTAKTISVNGDFESGLAHWQTSGDISLDAAHPLDGKASVRIGPGAGSIVQRIAVNGDNHLEFSALLHCDPAGAAKIVLRFLDANGNELMTVDSAADMSHGKQPDSIEDYLKPHPLTAAVEIVIAKDASPGTVEADDLKLEVYDDNDPSLNTAVNLDEAMKPLWQGNKVTNEAVLMMRRNGAPATGTLMFQPTRILSVTDYGLSTQYQANVDYTVAGRTLIATQESKMPRVNDADLLHEDLSWNVVGGKQVMVTYEHGDAWAGPVQAYVGEQMPGAIEKLSRREPLTIVAYGDSITFGIGSSHVQRIPPYQPPWIEMFQRGLEAAWNDPRITLYNSAQSGADSKWARSMAGRMVASLHPDLVVIAFGQNDFWRISAEDFAANISAVIDAVRAANPRAEFLLVSTMRFDPAYSTNPGYWDLVTQYDAKLRGLTGQGVQLVDFTAISGAVYAAKAPKDCLNDPLHPDDYLSRWYAQSMVAALAPPANRPSFVKK